MLVMFLGKCWKKCTHLSTTVLVTSLVFCIKDSANVDDLVGNAPGSGASGTGTNLNIADLKGNMSNSDKNAYSINMADYADGVTNPADSGRSTDIP